MTNKFLYNFVWPLYSNLDNQEITSQNKLNSLMEAEKKSFFGGDSLLRPLAPPPWLSGKKNWLEKNKKQKTFKKSSYFLSGQPPTPSPSLLVDLFCNTK